MDRADDKAAPWRAEHLNKNPARASFQRDIAIGAKGVAHRRALCVIERELAGEPIAVEQQLRAARQIGGERHRARLAPGGDHRIEVSGLHSTRSTKISILPPQARPTSQASSSAMPKSKRRGFPSRITSCASPTTAPSTQPPDTDPTNSPLSATASLAPAGRGEDPQVLTTVAKATPWPASRQRAACSRISAVSVILPSLFSPWAISFLRHRRRALPLRRRADHLDQGFEACQIMHRAELVDIGQHRLHPQ